MEPFGLDSPYHSHKFIGRFSFQGFQYSRKVIRHKKGMAMLLQLRMAGIMIAGDKSFFKCPVHSFDLPVCPGMVYPGQLMLNAMLNADTVKRRHIFFTICELNAIIC